MDLEKLKIDRNTAPRRRRRASRWPALVGLVVVLGLGWVFRAPLMRRIDRWTLLEVQAVKATRSSAASVAAVAGTAANGYVVAAKRAALSADTPGRVVELNVTEGSFVREGDVVARLYAEEYEAALSQASATLVAAQKAVERGGSEVESATYEVSRRGAERNSAAARLASAQADLRFSEKDLARRRNLVERKIETDDELDMKVAAEERARAAVTAAEADLQAQEAAQREGEAQLTRARAALAELEAQVEVARAAETQARATLEKTYVRAPFDGVIVLKDAEVGEVVSPNSQGGSSRGSVATLVDLDSLEVQIDLPETLLTQVKLEAPARIFLDAFPDEPYGGRVLRIWPTANRQKATIEIRVGFDAPDARLRPDLGARVVFSDRTRPPEQGEAPREALILIPESAVLQLDGQPGVFRLERDVVQFVPVETGERKGGRVAIEAGLSGGERLVLDPPSDLADGERVRVGDG